MPADIRLAGIQFEPEPKVVGEPVTFYAECRNAGDEGTGEFVARFVLDGSETFEMPVDNLAPGETSYAIWPHPPIAEGQHSIFCLLDATNVVPEPESRFNQQTIYFEVHQRSLPPSDADGSEYYSDDDLAAAVSDQIGIRVDHWMALVIQAVDEWADEAERRVEAWNLDGDADVGFVGVIAAFEKAVIGHVPGASQGMAIIESASDIYDAVQAARGNAPMGLSGAKAKLRAEIFELKQGAGAALRRATDGYQSRIAAWLSPKNDQSPLTWVEKGSTDSSYVGQLCDWLGFPVPTESNTTEPIKHELGEAFEEVFNRVATELEKEMGYR
jgi:hypothetical protein